MEDERHQLFEPKCLSQVYHKSLRLLAPPHLQNDSLGLLLRLQTLQLNHCQLVQPHSHVGLDEAQFVPQLRQKQTGLMA